MPSPPRALDKRPSLLIVAPAEVAGRLAEEATSRGLEPETVHDVASARVAMRERAPEIAVIDLGLGVNADLLEMVAELNARAPAVPTVALTASDALPDRLEVARRGGRGLLDRSTSPAQIINVAQGILERSRSAGTRVLAVDDDPTVLSVLEALLTPLGTRVTTLQDPLQMSEVLEQVVPELLILDVDMPRIGGIELCRVLRTDPRWATLPIVFLTAQRDPAIIERMFAAGADDFITKPIVGPELIMRIRNRLERVRLFRNLAETDPLTGVANRRRALGDLMRLMHEADRVGQTIALALLDIDRFKAINDRYGHMVGDDVLAHLGERLLRSFRSDDVVARWGGEEFAVGMYGISRRDGAWRVAEVLEALREIRIETSDGTSIAVTFSAGIAEYPTDASDVRDLLRVADQALYAAKAAGRDRVIPAGSVISDPGRADVAIVGDDDPLFEDLERALITRGHAIRRIPGGHAAARLLASDDPELVARVVVLDADGSTGDGSTVLRALADAGVLDHTRVLLLTDEAGEDGEHAAPAVVERVRRPVDVPALLGAIRGALDA